jgi:hypothetical protein
MGLDPFFASGLLVDNDAIDCADFVAKNLRNERSTASPYSGDIGCFS